MAGIGELVKGEVGTILSRVMIYIGIPIIGAMGSYIGFDVKDQMRSQAAELKEQAKIQSQSVKDIQRSVSELTNNVSIIQNTINIRGIARDSQINEINTKIGDHEGRIRVLERPPTSTTR